MTTALLGLATFFIGLIANHFFSQLRQLFDHRHALREAYAVWFATVLRYQRACGMLQVAREIGAESASAPSGEWEAAHSKAEAGFEMLAAGQRVHLLDDSVADRKEMTRLTAQITDDEDGGTRTAVADLESFANHLRERFAPRISWPVRAFDGSH